MAKKYDLVVKTGEYTDGNGEKKSRFLNVGAVMENDNGMYILLNRTFNPAGVPGSADRDNIIVSMFAADKKGGGNAPKDVTSTMNDDIPF